VNAQNLLRWTALIAAALVCTVGAARAHVFQQPVWYPSGQQRFFAYSAAFAAFALLFFIRSLRGWLLPLVSLIAAAYAIWFAGWAPVLALWFVVAAVYGIGLWIVRRLPLERSNDESSAAAFCLALVAGTAVWAFVAGLLAFSSWNSAGIYASLLAVPAIYGARSQFRSLRQMLESIRSMTASAAGYWVLVLLCNVLGAQFLMCLKPEVSADGIAMHLALPAHLAYWHSWHFDVTRVTWAVLPMAADWCFGTLYILGGEFAAKLLPLVFLAVNCILIARICRTAATTNAAMLLAAVYAATPVTQLTTGALFTDNIWLAFLLGAGVALLEFSEGGDAAYLVLAGLFLGSSLSTKLVGLAFVLSCIAAMFLSARTRADWSTRPRWMLAGACAALAISAAPPYLIALFKTGNPVFPFLNSIFHSPYYDTAKSFSDERFQAPLNWRVPLDLTFHTSRFIEGQDGAIGLTYLFALLLVLSAPPRSFRREVVAALVICATGFLINWKASSYVRYLAPAFPLILYAFAHYLGAIRLGQPGLYRAAATLTAAGVLTSAYLMPASGYWHKNFCLSPFARQAEARRYIEDSAPSRILVDQLNHTSPGEPVAFMTNGIAGLNAPAFSTGLHNFTFFRQLQNASSAADVSRLMARNGIRHFVAPLPACGAPPLPQLADFLRQYTHERAEAGCAYLADWNAEPDSTGP